MAHGNDVLQPVYDYVEGVYEQDPKRLLAALHPQFVKRGYGWSSERTEYVMTEMTAEELAALTLTMYAERTPRPIKEIVVLDALDQTASVKLTADWGIDYLHLARLNERWLILNVVWQAHPRETPQPEIHKQLELA